MGLDGHNLWSRCWIFDVKSCQLLTGHSVPCNIDLLLKYATVEGLEICRCSVDKKAASLCQLEEYAENSLSICNRQ